jgi:hypothetical protein
MSAPGEVAVVYPVEEYEEAAAANARKILADVSAVRHGLAFRVRRLEHEGGKVLASAIDHRIEKNA